MTCTEFDGLLYGYMERKVTPAQRDFVDAHRSKCPRCADLFRVAHEITCRELADFLDDYVEARLPADRRSVFERHLAICTDCVSYADSYRRTLRLCADTAAAPAPDVPPELLAAILAARRTPPGAE